MIEIFGRLLGRRYPLTFVLGNAGGQVGRAGMSGDNCPGSHQIVEFAQAIEQGGGPVGVFREETVEDVRGVPERFGRDP